jgi:soluble lytic murein transglycosylase
MPAPTPSPSQAAKVRAWCAPSLLLLLFVAVGSATAQTTPAVASAPDAALASGNQAVLQARELLSRKDKGQAERLAPLRQAAQAHPLAQWVDYWDLSSRLSDAQQPELTAFFTRWSGTYVEDRLRNDWLLELGRRADWANLREVLPKFRMNDDREVSCYGLLAQHLQGQDVREAARQAWFAQRDAGEACTQMARALVQAQQLSSADLWQEMRLSVESNRQRAARLAAEMLSPAVERALVALWDNPSRYLTRRSANDTALGAAHSTELDLLALMRWATTDPEAAAEALDSAPFRRLPAPLAATAWAHVAKQAVLKHQPKAAAYARQAWQLWDRTHKPGAQPPWSEELLEWHVRAALREGGTDEARWRLVLRAIDAMPTSALAAATPPGPAWSAAARADDREGTWVYWKAHALLALPASAAVGPDERNAAKQALQALSQQPSFYGQLALADLKRNFVLPAAPTALTEEELTAARRHAGLNRALHLISLNLRSEGVREWNYSLRGMDNRQLLAAAQLACDQAVWDRCINTSERTRGDISVAQRFPTPLREQVLAVAQSTGLDPALMLGLIRQESRFSVDVRSHVGASGLMQLMPATARWTAKKIGLNYKPEMITEPDTNLRLGAAYLKLLLDDFNGSAPMAAAAYNAGPGRPRRWREGPVLQSAAWAESIPFNETRDYVKKVLANTVVYNAVLGQTLVPLRQRLGPSIGPREASAPVPDGDLP